MPGRLDEPDDGPGEGRLAAARLADEPERLAAVHVERHAVHGAHVAHAALEDQALGDREVDLAGRRCAAARRRPDAAARGPDGRLGAHDASSARSRTARALALGRGTSRRPRWPSAAWRLLERRHLDAAAVLDVEAAGGERAADDLARQVRRLALDRDQLAAPLLVEPRDRAQQADGVGVRGRPKSSRRSRPLDDVAGVHDVDRCAHAGHHAEVVGDEDQRRAQLGRALGA
jgi:hypothetical protein